MTYPRKIDSWETSDHKTWTSEEYAINHEAAIARGLRITEMINAGDSVAVALDEVGHLKFYGKDADILAQITKDTGLTIRHWQCRDEPGYSVVDCDAYGQWWIGGDAGSWSGGYGARVSTTDLIRYARDTADRHGGKLPSVWTRPTDSTVKEPSE